MDWDVVDPPPRGGRALTVGAYLFVSAGLFGGAVVAAVLRVEFNDTGTSVVNGLHRYMTVPDAGGLRLALLAVIGFLVASTDCSVLAVAAARNSYRGLGRVVLAATSVVVGLLVVLWFVAPPAFAPRNGSGAFPIASGVHLLPYEVSSVPAAIHGLKAEACANMERQCGIGSCPSPRGRP